MQHIYNSTDNTDSTDTPSLSSPGESSLEQRLAQESALPSKKRSTRWDILWLFLLTRVMLVLVTYFGYILLTQPKYSSAPVDIWTLISHWNRWDATRYLHIALNGYQLLTPYHKPTGDFAFFPLFPALISIIGRPFGNDNYLLIGMLISNLALLGTLFFLYTLAEELGGEQIGRRTLLYLCIFPTAFFFFTAYNESLFLFFTTGGFLALRRQRWWLAGLAGGLSALTRSAGIFFVIPFLYELWVYRQEIKTRGATLISAVTPLILVPLGTLLYCLYNWQITGNPIAFASVQYLWARFLSWPWIGIWQNIGQVFWNQPFGSFSQVHSLIDLVMTLGFIALVIVGWRKSRMSYNIWLAFLLIYILVTPSAGQADGLISNQRFVLEMFPAFITLAFLGQRYPRLHEAIIWIFPMLLSIFSLLFVLGKWMV
jgi:Gpi18-like mannosyltransferase